MMKRNSEIGKIRADAILRKNGRVGAIVLFLYENQKGLVDHKELAKSLGVSKSNLSNIFKRIEYFFDKGKMVAPSTIQTRLKWFRQNAVASLKYYGEDKGLVVLRKIAPYYIKGLPNACSIRNQFNKITTLKEFDNIFKL